MSSPSGLEMSSPIALLPRLPTSKRCETPFTRAGTPHAAVFPRRVTDSWVLDLEHIGTPVGEHGRGGRHEDVARHFEYPNAVERTWHTASPSSDQN